MRGPFYSPLRLPDVLLDVARRSPLLAAYGVAAREATVTAAAGLRPDDLLFLGCAAGELPNAAVVALSEFYSLNRALVPQHVVFELDADDLATNTASTLRTLADVREMGFQLCISALGAQFTSLELIAEAQPDYLCLDPVLVAGARRRPDRRRRGAAAACASPTASAPSSSPPACATAEQQRLLRAQRGRAVLRRGLRARRHAAAAGDVPGLKRGGARRAAARRRSARLRRSGSPAAPPRRRRPCRW